MGAKIKIQEEWLKDEYPTEESHCHRRVLDMFDAWWEYLDQNYDAERITEEKRKIAALYDVAQNLFVNDDGQVPVDKEVIKGFVLCELLPFLLGEK
jgi:hypothetical protein